MGKEFVPHPQCTVASGECFQRSKCLAACRAGEKRDLAYTVRQLEGRVLELEKVIYRARLHKQHGQEGRDG